MKKILLYSLLLITPIATIDAKEQSMLFGGEDRLNIVVNNRILANVNGKPISVVDVMKKMDMHFYRQFPQYANSVSARFQYYNVNWKAVLSELIEKELILADAEESKLEVSGSDVREEMEKMFGPNIVENLDKADLTFDEAWGLIKDDIVIRRMTYYRINMKANKLVSPKDVRNKYDEFAEKYQRPDRWKYVMITVRGQDSTNNAEIANYLHQLLKEGVEIQDLEEVMQQNGYMREGTKFRISDVYDQTAKEIPENNRTILKQLSEGEFSDPVAQRSRADNSMVFRIFSVQELIEGGKVPFSTAESEIRDMLVKEHMKDQTEKYFTRLRKHYNVNESQLNDMVPEDFKPFAMQ